MKKNGLFYVCVLFLLMIGAVGCSKDCSNDNENFVQEVVATEKVNAFFEKDNKIMTESLIGGFFTDEDWHEVEGSVGTVPPSLVKIRTIRSQEELESAYKGALELPQIDFNQYVLLVGLTYSASGQESLGKVRLLHGQGDSYELQVIMYWNTNTNYGYFQIFSPVLFWRLYPKFPTNHMNVVRRTEKVWLD